MYYLVLFKFSDKTYISLKMPISYLDENSICFCQCKSKSQHCKKTKSIFIVKEVYFFKVNQIRLNKKTKSRLVLGTKVWLFFHVNFFFLFSIFFLSIFLFLSFYFFLCWKVLYSLYLSSFLSFYFSLLFSLSFFLSLSFFQKSLTSYMEKWRCRTWF